MSSATFFLPDLADATLSLAPWPQPPTPEPESWNLAGPEEQGPLPDWFVLASAPDPYARLLAALAGQGGGGTDPIWFG